MIISPISSSSFKIILIPSDFLHRASCDLWVKTIVLLPFPSGYCLFPLLALWYYLQSLAKCWKEWRWNKHLCLVLDLRVGSIASFTMNYDISCSFSLMPIITLKKFSYTEYTKLFKKSEIDVGVYKICFLLLWCCYCFSLFVSKNYIGF